MKDKNMLMTKAIRNRWYLYVIYFIVGILIWYPIIILTPQLIFPLQVVILALAYIKDSIDQYFISKKKRSPLAFGGIEHSTFILATIIMTISSSIPIVTALFVIDIFWDFFLQDLRL